jgi:hypothetical protein
MYPRPGRPNSNPGGRGFSFAQSACDFVVRAGICGATTRATGDQQDLFRSRLDQIMDMKHPLVKRP